MDRHPQAEGLSLRLPAAGGALEPYRLFGPRQFSKPSRPFTRRALAAAHVNEGLARFTSRPPKAPLAGVRMAKYKMWFSPAKAVRELGLPQTPPRQALADAVEWFRQHQYVRK